MADINKVSAVIRSSNGRFFSVEFTKKNGEFRKMNARLGVTKHLRGGSSTTSHIDRLITVFDAQKKQYRKINMETVSSVTVNGVRYDF